MAYELLEHMHYAPFHPDTAPFAYATHHDLESLVYTFSYTTYRRVYEEIRGDRLPEMILEEQIFLRKDFERFFGRDSISGIKEARRDLVFRFKGSSGRVVGDIVFDHLPDVISGLCQVLFGLLSKQYPQRSTGHIAAGLAADSVLARVQRLIPDVVEVEAEVPPPVYLSCEKVKHIVNSFITVPAQRDS